MNMELVFQTVIVGIGATLFMDLWSLFQKHIVGIAPLNYALVGRWILWLPRENCGIIQSFQRLKCAVRCVLVGHSIT